MKHRYKISLVAGLLLIPAGLLHFPDKPVFGWICIVAGLGLVAQYIWLKRKAFPA